MHRSHQTHNSNLEVGIGVGRRVPWVLHPTSNRLGSGEQDYYNQKRAEKLLHHSSKGKGPERGGGKIFVYRRTGLDRVLVL